MDTRIHPRPRADSGTTPVLPCPPRPICPDQCGDATDYSKSFIEPISARRIKVRIRRVKGDPFFTPTEDV